MSLFDVGRIQVSDDLPGRGRSSCDDCTTRPFCIFSKLGSQQLRSLQPSVKERTIKRGELLTEEGAVSEAVYVVKVGIAFWRRRALCGASLPIGIAGRGAVFGLSGFSGRASQGSGVAASLGRLCAISVNALKEFAVNHPQIVEHLAERATINNGWIASWSAGMRVNGVVRQLSHAVLLLADFQRTSVIELPNQSGLAELLGTTRETVVRAMAVLEKSGSLRHIERHKFEVSRPELMERLSTASTSRQCPSGKPTQSAGLARIV